MCEGIPKDREVDMSRDVCEQVCKGEGECCFIFIRGKPCHTKSMMSERVNETLK